jgi:exosortase
MAAQELSGHPRSRSWLTGWLILATGGAVFAVPTFISVAQQSWSSEQGAHGPILLAISLWLIVRQWPTAAEVARPGRLGFALPSLAVALLLHLAARVMEWVIVDAYSLWLCGVIILYAFAGWASLVRLWFPVTYMLFAFPFPQGVLITATQPLRLWLTDAAVNIMGLFAYPVSHAGVNIFIGPYAVLVEQACSGLSSMISLTAIGLFYAYISHAANWRYCLYFSVAMVAIASLANLVRIIILLLITYHFGDAVGQGFLHDFAGLTLFALSTAGMLVLDRVSEPVRRFLAAKK